ncbi:MAG: hypothetical protein F9K24_13750 [Leptonema illini]|uniref:Uncharacterized protein n=1 Tax=Leptonema illini TaxID=183 RepID=A0A833LXP8_9LEPT|nr:MAG: hypothetical protein F9K24_13750 [Leptonema illini]
MYRANGIERENMLWFESVYTLPENTESNSEFNVQISVLRWKQAGLRCHDDVIKPLMSDLKPIALREPILHSPPRSEEKGEAILEMLTSGDDGPAYYLHRCYIDKSGRTQSIIVNLRPGRNNIDGMISSFEQKKARRDRWVADLAAIDK